MNASGKLDVRTFNQSFTPYGHTTTMFCIENKSNSIYCFFDWLYTITLQEPAKDGVARQTLDKCTPDRALASVFSHFINGISTVGGYGPTSWTGGLQA